jgi:uncharacterized protein (DUF2164 family)
MTGVKAIVLLATALFFLSGCQDAAGSPSDIPAVGAPGIAEEPQEIEKESEESLETGAIEEDIANVPEEPPDLMKLFGADMTGISIGMTQEDIISLLGKPTFKNDQWQLIYTEPPIDIEIDGAVCTAEVFRLDHGELMGVYFYMERVKDAERTYDEMIRDITETVSEAYGPPVVPQGYHYGLFNIEGDRLIMQLGGEDRPEFLCEAKCWENGLSLQFFHYNDNFMISYIGWFLYNPLAPMLGETDSLLKDAQAIRIHVTKERELLRLVGTTPVSVEEGEIGDPYFYKDYVFSDDLKVQLIIDTERDEEYHVHNVTANSPVYVTGRGLRVGDSVEKLIRLYGMPSGVLDERSAETHVRLYGSQPDWTANEWTYSDDGDYPSHKFVVVGGYVTQIHIYGRW